MKDMWKMTSRLLRREVGAAPSPYSRMRATKCVIICVAVGWLAGHARYGNSEVTPGDARRIRQIVEGGRANYLAFDNFVCRLRIRVGKAATSATDGVPRIMTESEVAEANWIRAGAKEFFSARLLKTSPQGQRGGEFTPSGHILSGTFVHDGQSVIIRDAGYTGKKPLGRLRISSDPAGAPMEALHTWNTYGFSYNDRGVIWMYLSQLLSSLPKPARSMVSLSVVTKMGHRLHRIDFDLGGTPPIRDSVWADPERGYIAVRNEFAIQGSPPRIGVVEDLREFSGHWFPWKARAWFADSNVVFETEVLELKLGAARNADFVLNVPKGSVVSAIGDSSGKQVVLNASRHIGLDDVPKLLSDIADQPIPGRKRESAASGDRLTTLKWALIICGVALVIGGLYARIRRS